MESMDNIRDAAKDKLFGFTEREIECFVKGVKYMAYRLPLRRSDEWLCAEVETCELARFYDDESFDFWKQVTGLNEAVKHIKFPYREDYFISAVFDSFLDDVVSHPDTRKKELNDIEATDNKILSEILNAIKTGIEGFNGYHKTQLNFQRGPDNGKRFTFSWEGSLTIEKSFHYC